MIDRTRLFALVSAEMIAADEIFGTYQQMEEDRWLRVLVEEVEAVARGIEHDLIAAEFEARLVRVASVALRRLEARP